MDDYTPKDEALNAYQAYRVQFPELCELAQFQQGGQVQSITRHTTILEAQNKALELALATENLEVDGLLWLPCINDALDGYYARGGLSIMQRCAFRIQVWK